uniref:Uncharacterized protein n=1 Tax=Arundo donax TaxID=35708 RepID=A0A0A9BLM5_ARUDO
MVCRRDSVKPTYWYQFILYIGTEL